MKAVALVAVTAVAIGIALIVLMLIRRLTLTISKRRDAKIITRLRPTALALAMGDDHTLPELDRRAAGVFARLLAEVAVELRGESLERISLAAEQSGLIDGEIRTLRRSRRAWRRATAASILGRLAARKAVGPLVDALSDPNRDVRTAAMLGLGRVGAVEAAPSIIATLDTRAVPRAVVVHTILRLGSAAVPALRVAASNGEPQARRTCIELLGHLGDPSDGRGVLAHLRDPSPDVRAAAARTLGRLGSRDAVGPLIDALDDPEGFVCGAAAEGLGRLRARSAIPGLLRLARTPDSWWAAAAAARAVARIDPDATRRAAAAWGSPPGLREAADLLSL